MWLWTKTPGAMTRRLTLLACLAGAGAACGTGSGADE